MKLKNSTARAIAIAPFIVAPLLLIGALCSGCFGPDVAKALKSLGNDPATVHMRVTSIYGTVELVRTAPQGDSLAHTVAPDGTITVSREGMPLLPGVADTNRTEQLRHLDGILNGKPAQKPPSN
jgi:hypothetical protein